MQTLNLGPTYLAPAINDLYYSVRDIDTTSVMPPWVVESGQGSQHLMVSGN